MLNRLKGALVESYVGAIGLGYLLAQGVLHFVAIFASPVATWISRKQYGYLVPGANTPPTTFPFEVALPDFIRFSLLLIVWVFLMRWLYFAPVKIQSPEPDASADQTR